MNVTPQDVLLFWYGSLDAAPSPEQMRMWWTKSDKTDQRIREMFEATVEAAARGELEHWKTEPQGHLAIVLVLDQFSRNIYRETPLSFAQDPQGLAHALAMIEAGMDRQLPPWQRIFVYIPLEHSEELPMQQKCLDLFDQLIADLPDESKAMYTNYRDFAQKHYDIIERFGRFPHRNAILGRQSTPEELEFLKQPGSSF